MSGGVLSLVLNFLIIVQSETIGDVVKDFIAFGVIAEIDNYLAMTIVMDRAESAGDSEIKFDKNQLKIGDFEVMKSWFS